jgi:hypothetical protein
VQDTKLTFSEEEMNAVTDIRFFFVKHEVTRKIMELFGSLEKELAMRISDYPFLMKKELQIREKGKTFRGENYRQLPYVLLDFPRVFTTTTVFSFRSMFWWGNEFSFTLHLQGQALDNFRENIRREIQSLKSQGFYFGVNDTPWEYTFDKKNYRPLDELIYQDLEGLRNLISTKHFLKLSRKLELNKYKEATQFGVETFTSLMNILQP